MQLRSKLVPLVVSTALAVAGLGVFAGPAQAAPGDTIATFAITGGTLSISVPASTVALATGTVNTGAATAAAQLGTVSVNDARGALLNHWTATVSSTTFVTGGGSASETVAKASIAYSSGAATSTTGLGAFVPGVLANLTNPGTAASWTGAAGNDTAAWDPTLTFTLLSSQVAGTYTGTITHSVA
jgi:hypothetical protein